MSYDVEFCFTNDARKQEALAKISQTADQWERASMEGTGMFYGICGWAFSDFIGEMRRDIGIKNTEDKDSQSFFVKVGDLRKLAAALDAYMETEGAQKYEMYLDLFGCNGLHIYDPDRPPVVKDDPDYWSEEDCWVTFRQAAEMRKALMTGGAYMDELWDIIRFQGYFLNGFSKAMDTYFFDAPNDELVLVNESY